MKTCLAVKCKSGLLAGILVAFFASTAFGHNLWLNPETHYPETGRSIEIGIGWGHAFTEDRTDESVRDDLIHKISAIGPDGREIGLERKSPERYMLSIDKPGLYVVSARTRPGAFTMTPEGRKWGDKTEVDRAIRCVAHRITAQTVIIAGSGEPDLSAGSPLPLSVKLLADPSTLEKGDELPVQLLFEGEPLGNADLKARYAGYEHEEEGHGHGHGAYPVETSTDGQGTAHLSLTASGYWIVQVSHRPPYPDTDVCDEYMYNLAFTLSSPASAHLTRQTPLSEKTSWAERRPVRP